MKIWMVFHLNLLSRIRRQDSGQSLVEVALMLPVVFMMTFGLINFCLLLFSMGNANFASRAALRYASTHSSTSYVPATQQVLNTVVAPYIYAYPSNTYSVNVSYYTPGSGTGTNTVGSGLYVTLTVSYPFSILGHNFSPISFTTTGCGIVLQ